ncbi:MAG: hypothetical protein UZ03_NOB001002374 [Nitrospira sp. OLB3]|nr:MAG: hypothetical protein UZ03_NOB001002374 [Nitrospira sp. OLB3]
MRDDLRVASGKEMSFLGWTLEMELQLRQCLSL